MRLSQRRESDTPRQTDSVSPSLAEGIGGKLKKEMPSPTVACDGSFEGAGDGGWAATNQHIETGRAETQHVSITRSTGKARPSERRAWVGGWGEIYIHTYTIGVQRWGARGGQRVPIKQ